MNFKKKKYLDTNDLDIYGTMSPARFLLNRYKTTNIVNETFLINRVPEEEFAKFINQHFKKVTFKLAQYGCIVTVNNTSFTKTIVESYNFKEINHDPNKSYWSVNILAINQTIANKIKNLFKPYIPEEYKENNIPNVNFIAQDRNGMYLKSLSLKRVDINLEDDYLTNVPLKKVEKLVQSIPGLYIFTGSPGTGKSYFIRHLASLDTQVVILQQNQIGLLTDPSFQEFAFSSLKDTLLILEDCEKVLEDRNRGNSNNLTSVMLNLTDGILNEALNIKIVVTLNTVENIDKALLRAGRLISFVEFDKLPVDKANNVARRIGSKAVYTEPTELAKIYNTEDTGKEEVAKPTIGFNK